MCDVLAALLENRGRRVVERERNREKAKRTKQKLAAAPRLGHRGWSQSKLSLRGGDERMAGEVSSIPTLAHIDSSRSRCCVCAWRGIRVLLRCFCSVGGCGGVGSVGGRRALIRRVSPRRSRRTLPSPLRRCGALSSRSSRASSPRRLRYDQKYFFGFFYRSHIFGHF